MKSIVLCLLLAFPVIAQPPKGHYPDPAPAPAPLPDSVKAVDLSADQLYVFGYEVEVMVKVIPDGVLQIDKDDGPIRIRGIFWGGNGGRETRLYKDKFVFSVSAIHTGAATMIVVPVGAKTVDEWVIKQFNVTVGPPPIPPGPPNPPDPPGPPAPGPKTDKVWAITVTDISNRDTDTAHVLADLTFWKGLESAGHKFRHLDIASDEAKNKKYVAAMASANVTAPALILLDKNGKILKLVKLPTSTAGIKSLIDGVTK